MKPNAECVWCDVGEEYVCFYCEEYHKQKESEMYSLMGYDRTGMLVEQFDVPTKEEADKTLLKLQEGDDKHDPIDWEVVTKGELDEA